jgi:hypothetical protein
VTASIVGTTLVFRATIESFDGRFLFLKTSVPAKFFMKLFEAPRELYA